jgi:mycoredoxin-dependent peroxiredoxin
LKAYQSDIAKFDATDTQLLGISVDSFAANAEFAKKEGITFPLLSDFKRETSKKYGILNDEYGFAMRTTFVVDKEGIIRHIEQGSSAVDPSGAYQVCSAFPKK